MNTNQCATVLWHMKEYGSITHKEADDLYGIARLAARISDLRRQGYKIVSETVTGKGRDGRVTHFSRYRLEVIKDD